MPSKLSKRKKNTDVEYTHIAVLVDGSGSMARLTDDTIGGLNSFLETQRAAKGKATLTLCQFSTRPTMIHRAQSLTDVPPVTRADYVPQGGTALLDALGHCIEEVKSYIEGMEETSRPGKVVFLIITDGQENSSTKFSKANILRAVQAQEEEGWNFIYMGANVDAFAEAASIGVRTSNALNFNASHDMATSYSLASQAITSMRSSRQRNVKYDLYAGAADVGAASSLNFDAIVRGTDAALSEEDDDNS